MNDFREISSRENSLIKHILELQSSAKKRQKSGLFVLEGLRICKDAYENEIVFDKLIVSASALEKQSEWVEKFSENAQECVVLPDSLFKKISETETPQGIIVLGSRPENQNKIDPKGKFVALQNIQDPANLGAIARSCEALGVSGIILSSTCCDPYAPKSLRASMGTLLRMPVIILDDFVATLKESGLKTYGCVVDKDACDIKKAEFSEGSAILIGNEANGLTEEAKRSCDKLITIPMKGKAESLNAAAAAAIAIWEMMQ